MNVKELKQRDLFEKNTILMIVYGIAAYIGAIAQIFLERPLGIALSLFLPVTVALGFYFVHRSCSCWGTWQRLCRCR